jgi:hypothetical protein
MSQRSEHGGGEAAINRANAESIAYNEEKRNRKLGETAIHEIDRIIQEENERCALQAETLAKIEEAEEYLPPKYD